MHLELGFTKIQYTRWEEILRFYCRTIAHEEHKLPREIYEWNLLDYSVGWARDITKIYDKF